MKYTKILTTAAAALTLGAGFSSAAAATAATGPGITIGGNVTGILAAGRSAPFYVVVTNTSAVSKHVKIRAHGSRTVNSWNSFSSASLTLAANTSELITDTVTVPATARPGAYADQVRASVGSSSVSLSEAIIVAAAVSATMASNNGLTVNISTTNDGQFEDIGDLWLTDTGTGSEAVSLSITFDNGVTGACDPPGSCLQGLPAGNVPPRAVSVGIQIPQNATVGEVFTGSVVASVNGVTVAALPATVTMT